MSVRSPIGGDTPKQFHWNHKHSKKHGISISIDFDGCLVENAYPRVGGDAGAWPYLKKLHDAGASLMLNTARSLSHSWSASTPEEVAERLQAALSYVDEQCGKYDMTIDVVSMRLPGKLHAHIYLDDHGLGCPTKMVDGQPCVDWSIVGPWLLRIAGIKDTQDEVY